MKIAVYQTTDDVPEHLRFIAQLVNGSKFQFVHAVGSSAEEVRGRMEKFWVEQRTKHRPEIDAHAEIGIGAPVVADVPAPKSTNLMDLLG